MNRILLINPNSNEATTAMMVRIAQSAASGDIEIIGATARRSPLVITDPVALAAAGAEVVELGLRQGAGIAGIIISAFGDPGITELRRQSGVPVVGIAEAAMLAASDNDRRFGVATTTPDLVASIDARAVQLGVARLYTGTRITPGDPLKVMRIPIGWSRRCCVRRYPPAFRPTRPKPSSLVEARSAMPLQR